jgi:hypothetical protein
MRQCGQNATARRTRECASDDDFEVSLSGGEQNSSLS